MIYRNANRSDAPGLAELVALLGHDIDAANVAANLEKLEREGLPQIVAERDGRLVGLLGLDRMTPLYRPQPVARITILVVAEECREEGTGKTLVDLAIAQAKRWGCGIIEVTSNERLIEAHAFYRHIGFERSSYRFFRAVH